MVGVIFLSATLTFFCGVQVNANDEQNKASTYSKSEVGDFEKTAPVDVSFPKPKSDLTEAKRRESVESVLTVARHQLQAHNYELAIRYLSAIVKAVPDNNESKFVLSDAHQAYGDSLLAEGQDKKAALEFKASLVLIRSMCGDKEKPAR
jgi:tetratricopeptide (TPR) repeat protein